MSSTNKTANLKMHSWVRTDPVVCEDFNDNFNKLDEVVGGLTVSRGNCEIYSGSYVGNGKKALSLTFPKRPVYLIVQRDKLNRLTYNSFVVDGTSFFSYYDTESSTSIYVNGKTVTIQETGTGNATVLNISGITYYYAAFAPAE